MSEAETAHDEDQLWCSQHERFEAVVDTYLDFEGDCDVLYELGCGWITLACTLSES